MTTATSPAYIPRHLTPMLRAALADTPVVCLLGPRQCGKSTLARHCDPKRAYINLDDRNFLELARRDPEGFIDELPEQVAIDEIQRVPELTLAIKRSVDAHRRPGRFLLTGSANLLQLPRLADSLAGRMECLYLHPLTEAEKIAVPGRFLDKWLNGKLAKNPLLGRGPAASELPARLVTGGYPEAFSRNPRRARRWQQQYLQSIIERDIHDVADIRDGQQVARLMEYLSQQTATLLNVSAMANALGHTRPTIERYLGVLEKLFLIRPLPAWHSNRSKRLVKTPKIHFCDSGLAATLGELDAWQWNEQRARFGHLLESFVLQQLVAMADCMQLPPRFYYYRDKDKSEVDLVLERGGNIWGIEIKAASRVNNADAKGLLKLAGAAADAIQGGIVFYDGSVTFSLDKEANIQAIPISALWQY